MDDVAKKEEERINRTLNRQSGVSKGRTSTWGNNRSSTNFGAVTPPTTTPSPSATATTSSNGKENWREKRDREERERKEREEKEKQDRLKKLNDELSHREDLPNYIKGAGTSELSEPVIVESAKVVNRAPTQKTTTYTPTTSTTPTPKVTKTVPKIDKPKQTPAERAIDTFDNLINDMVDQTPKAEKQDSYADSNRYDLSEVDDLINSFDKKPKERTQQTKPAPIPEPPKTVHTDMDDLESLLNNLASSKDTQKQEPKYEHPPKNLGSSYDEVDSLLQVSPPKQTTVVPPKPVHEPVAKISPKPSPRGSVVDSESSFLCGKCGLGITGTHIDAKGKLYHLECVGGDTCAKCSKPISALSVHAAERIWHPECFQCANCSKLLQDSYVRKGQDIWCKECYSADLICERCNQPLLGQFVTTKGKKFHSECFTCSNCSVSLGTDFYDVEGQFQCNSCYNKSIGTCAGCERPLSGQYIKCLEKAYHEECFVCFGCKKPLEEDFFNVGGNPHCYNCAISTK